MTGGNPNLRADHDLHRGKQVGQRVRRSTSTFQRPGRRPCRARHTDRSSSVVHVYYRCARAPVLGRCSGAGGGSDAVRVKFSIDAGSLGAAIQEASVVVPKVPSLAVFSCVLVKATEGRVEVTGSAEQETEVAVSTVADGVKAGQLVMQPGPLSKYLRTLPSSSVVHVSSGTGTHVQVTAEGGRPYRFRTVEQTFPSGGALGSSDRHEANLSRLGQALSVVSACARETQIVQLVSSEDGLSLYATDGKRLAHALLPEAGFGDFSGLVTLDALKAAARGTPTAVHVNRAGRAVMFEADDRRVTARLIEDTYPPVSSVLDVPPPNSVVVATGDFRDALSRSGAISDGVRPLLVSVDGGEMTVSVDSADVGSGSETVQLSEAATVAVAFSANSMYLTQAAAALSGRETVTLSWSTPEDAVFFSSESPFHAAVVVMPVRVG